LVRGKGKRRSEKQKSELKGIDAARGAT